MTLRELEILNYKNIRETRLSFSPKLNCLVGLNGQGKTNILDAIYLLSFTKSKFNPIDSLNITHGEDLSLVRGHYVNQDNEETTVSCGLKRGVKKQFRLGPKDYKRLIDHIGVIPLVMVSPEDGALIEDGSDERRRLMDAVISQQDRKYLEQLTQYTALLKQRNAALKQLADQDIPTSADAEQLLEIYEQQMIEPANYIYEQRTIFVERFIPIFEQLYQQISGNNEQVSLRYVSQLKDRDLGEAFIRTRSRDLILGWTSQGIHKDDMEMLLDGYPLKRVGSQGQQKTYLISLKLAQALYLGKPILLLDDIFDKLDSERVSRILTIVQSDQFGQIFITDTDRQHLTSLNQEMRVFHVVNGQATD